MVMKVSAAYRGGISTGERNQWVPPPPNTNWPPLLIAQEEVSQTELSRKLSPPSKPDKRAIGRSWSWTLAIFAPLGLVIVLGIVGNAAAGWVGQAIGGALGLMVQFVIIGFYTRRANQLYKQAMSRWAVANNRWNQAYYCARDDIVFIPGQTLKTPVPPEMRKRTGALLLFVPRESPWVPADSFADALLE